MLIIPAIDIQGGCVVRFTQGALNKKIYSRDPVKTARHWVKQGARFIHIVDLDGAFSGTPKNLDAVIQIIKAIEVPVEFGGGIRDIKTIKQLFGYGIQRIVLGTRAIEDEVFLKNVFEKFKDRVIVSVDTRSGNILTEGWKSKFRGCGILGFANILKEAGFKQMIYTDVAKDGTLKGPNIKGIKRLLKGIGIKIIASGGISSLDDIRRLKLLEGQGLTGVIIGKALYEGKLVLSQALKAA